MPKRPLSRGRKRNIALRLTGKKAKALRGGAGKREKLLYLNLRKQTHHAKKKRGKRVSLEGRHEARIAVKKLAQTKSTGWNKRGIRKVKVSVIARKRVPRNAVIEKVLREAINDVRGWRRALPDSHILDQYTEEVYKKMVKKLSEMGYEEDVVRKKLRQMGIKITEKPLRPSLRERQQELFREVALEIAKKCGKPIEEVSNGEYRQKIIDLVYRRLKEEKYDIDT